jgi:hypothetical protein
MTSNRNAMYIMAKRSMLSMRRVRNLDWGSVVHDVETEEVYEVALMANIDIVIMGGMVEMEMRDIPEIERCFIQA